MTQREHTRAFRAMNTDVTVTVIGTRVEAALDDVEALFARAETALSRFRPESELSQLNRCAGRPFVATPILLGAVRAAIRAARSTAGLFDPTILPQLRAAGYDRSFEQITGEERPPAERRADWRASQIDRDTITLPPGAEIDLGGIGKGWTVDLAARGLARFAGFAIDAGGDIRVGGVDGQPWRVCVADPFTPGRDLLALDLDHGAIATSTTQRRRWIQAGQLRHHLIDPRTGRSAATGVASATVLAPTAARAETLTKAALLLGPDVGIAWLRHQSHAAGLLVLDDGTVRTTFEKEAAHAA